MNYADELLYDTFNQTEAPYTSEALIALLQSSTSFATDKLIAFIGDASRKGMRLVLITSGGTATPLEKSAVRFIDNFSTGNRGAAAAECFLKQGDNLSPQYAVIFLYRRGSAMPFTRRIELYNLARSCIVSENDNVLLKDGAVARASTDLQSSQKRLFLIPYVTLGDYLLSLRALSAYVRQAGSSAMLFLAAAVSDFHVPYIELPVHKIQSADRELELKLRKVPKMLGVIAQRWMPEAFVVSFKVCSKRSCFPIFKSVFAIHTSSMINHIVANCVFVAENQARDQPSSVKQEGQPSIGKIFGRCSCWQHS